MQALILAETQGQYFHKDELFLTSCTNSLTHSTRQDTDTELIYILTVTVFPVAEIKLSLGMAKSEQKFWTFQNGFTAFFSP